MPWIRLDDQIAHHPKFAAAGPIASWLFVCGLSYCNRYLTDGLIPMSALAALGSVPQASRHASALVSVGLWDRVDGGYRVHDYHVYQPTREEVERRQEQRRHAGRIGGRRSADLRKPSESLDHPLKHPLKQNASNAPAKSNPVPDPGTDASKEQKHLRLKADRRGVIFSGRRFDVTERMFANLTKGYGDSRVDAVDWLAQFSAWDADAQARDLPVDEPLGWLRVRVKALMGNGAVPGRTTAAPDKYAHLDSGEPV